jgi:hypothetical protein
MIDTMTIAWRWGKTRWKDLPQGTKKPDAIHQAFL